METILSIIYITIGLFFTGVTWFSKGDSPKDYVILRILFTVVFWLPVVIIAMGGLTMDYLQKIDKKR